MDPAAGALLPAAPPDNSSLRFGAPGADDSKRSPDEVRIIMEMAREEVESFLQANPTLESSGAADQLRREHPHIQLLVVERGPLRHCRDPSGVVITRIRSAKNGTLGKENSDRPSKFQAVGGDNNPQRQTGPPGDGQEKKEFKVKKVFVGALIGRGGEIVKAMQAEAGCKIGIDQKDETSDEATVIIGPGSAEQLAVGEHLVTAKVQARIQELNEKGIGKGKGGGKGGFMGNQPLMLSDAVGFMGSQPPPPAFGDLAGGNGGAMGGGAQQPAKPIDEQSLQDEALNYIQALNYS